MVQSEPVRLQDFRKNLLKLGISNRTVDIMCSSWSKGTNKQYQSAWIIWTNWCRMRGLDTCNVLISQFLDFLSEQFHLGKSYSILNTYRSAISSTHVFIDNMKIGQHPLVVRFFKGLSILRPPMPRYTTVWDVDLVLKYLKTLSPSEDLCLKLLSFKLVALIALVTAQRVQTMKHMNIAEGLMFQSSKGVTFLINARLKTSKPGELSEVFLERFNHDPELCVVRVLMLYLDKTKTFRISDKHNSLFLSFIKPHKEVTSATLARWLLHVLSSSGINIDVFKAHSYRTAAVSCARKRGVSVVDIMKTANWKSKSTFSKFYHKPTAFAKTVLNVNRE